MLKAESLSYGRDGYQVFSCVNFEIKPGTCLFVQGENGSGKSTLLRILCGYLPLQNGSVTIDGANISDDRDFVAHKVEYVGHLNAIKKQMTALENLEFWNSVCDIQKSMNLDTESSDPMCVRSFKNRLVSFCSVGQVRRLALSRLNVSSKKIWLLDEPTTSLDENGIKNFVKMLETHCENDGLAVITTHHEMKMTNIKSELINLSRSKKIEVNSELDPFLNGDW